VQPGVNEESVDNTLVKDHRLEKSARYQRNGNENQFWAI